MPYIVECIESIINHMDAHLNIEVIVVDDGSEDSTAKWLRQRLSKAEEQLAAEGAGHRVVLLRTEHRGLPHALNVGLHAASSNLVGRMDADDLCMPGRWEIQARFLAANPTIAVCGGFAVKFGEALDDQLVTVPVHPHLLRWRLFTHTPLLHPTVALRRDLLASEGILNSSTKEGPPEFYRQRLNFASDTGSVDGETELMVEDLDLWLRVSRVFPCGLSNVAMPLVWLRQHLQQKSVVESEDAFSQATFLHWQHAEATLRGRSPVSLSSVRLLRRPNDVGTLEELQDAIHTLDAMQDYFSQICESAEDSYLQKLMNDSNDELRAQLAVAAVRNLSGLEHCSIAQTVGLSQARMLQALLSTKQGNPILVE
jgi:hypothetical protein